MTLLPKEEPERDEDYLDWIRDCPCWYCRWESGTARTQDGLPIRNDAHHIKTGGTGTKCSDYLTVPLCKPSPYGRGCHFKADKSKKRAAELEPVAIAYRRYYLKYVKGGGDGGARRDGTDDVPASKGDTAGPSHGGGGGGRG